MDNVRQGESLKTVKFIEEDFFWAAYVPGVAFRDTSEENIYAFEPIEDLLTSTVDGFYTMLDTGSTAIMISSLYYESYVRELFARSPDADWFFDNNNLYTQCSADMPNLYFMIDNHWIEVNPRDYML